MTELTKKQKLALIYRHTHRDFKGNHPEMGKTIMVFRDGTCLVSLDNLTDDEIADRIELALSREHTRKAKLAAKKAAK